MIYKVGILGATGRVGREIASFLSQGFQFKSDFFELSDAVASSKKWTRIEDIEVRLLEEPSRENVHIWIDFSRPEATIKLLETIHTPIVIGTTGFSEPQLKQVRDYSAKHPVLLASNTSLGLNAMGEFLERFPSKETFPAEVILTEEHHRHKKDAPSGTAKTLLEMLKRRGREDVQVHVTRAGNIVGVHSVKFVAEDEEIEIIHRVSERRVFARGALVAAQFLLTQKQPGMYSMREVFLEV